MRIEKILKVLYRPVLKRAALHALEGRLLEPGHAEKGRWLRADVEAFLRSVWDKTDELLPQAHLADIPTYGNRHNVFLAVATTAAYRVLLESGTPREHAMTLIADVGWKIYSRLLLMVARPIRMTTRDPQTRIDRTLRMLLIFPFSAPGAPGYAVKAWAEEGRFYTHWTHCPPHTFVRQLVEGGPDSGELEAFYRSWCLYDWAAADLLANDGEKGHYSRPCTLSKGDSVCNMCWFAEAKR